MTETQSNDLAHDKNLHANSTPKNNPMKSSLSNSRDRRGFTMVEILVVIVIIAVLATLGFVGGRRAMDAAARAKTVGNVKQLVATHQLFANENNGAVVDWDKTVVNGQKRNWAQHLLVTLANDLANNDNYKNSPGDTLARSFGIFSDPKSLKAATGKLAKTGHNSWRTYAYNNRIGTYTPDSPEPIVYKQGAKFTHQVENPNKLILFSQRTLDGDRYHPFLQPEDGKNDKLGFSIYNGSIMVGFYDGHVDMMTKINYPSAVGNGINPTTGAAYTKEQWNEYWWGRSTPIPPPTL